MGQDYDDWMLHKNLVEYRLNELDRTIIANHSEIMEALKIMAAETKCRREKCEKRFDKIENLLSNWKGKVAGISAVISVIGAFVWHYVFGE